MDDPVETLLVDVRASTSGFRSDVEAMRATLDGTLVDGFGRAGQVLERGLLSAIRRGQLGFDELKAVAFRALNEIAAQALQSGIAQIFGPSTASGAQGGNLASMFGSVLSSLFGLPGRATGGPVSPGSAYVVGERGPELFVPTSAGRVESGLGQPARDVRVAITLAAPRGSEAPVMLRRSSRQVASAVARAMRET
jgi:hypothetical protein